jgi:hypothetical protein
MLLEELEKRGSAEQQESNFASISIRDNSDLKSFALKVLDLAEKSDLKSDIQSGKVEFTLDIDGKVNCTTGRNQQSSIPDPVYFPNGLVTEKDITGLANGTNRISVGKTVCFTPLAMDEIRRKGLNVERIPK